MCESTVTPIIKWLSPHDMTDIVLGIQCRRVVGPTPFSAREFNDAVKLARYILDL